MTEGKISKSIILFALPILFGNLFQQLYTVVDSIVVGNVIGKEALAAVSSTGSIINLIIGLINGIFVGAGVIIARYYGARNKEHLSLAVHTTMAFGLIAGIAVTIIGIMLAPWLLKVTATPDDVFADAVKYLRLYFVGGTGIVMYNACMGVFQAIGDSRRPLHYLIIASIMNIILCILFVVVFNFGIGGTAIATAISQVVSAILGFIALTNADGDYKVEIKKIKINGEMLKILLKMGLPTGIQNSIVAFANVIVQSNINQFGSVVMAGNGSYTKLEGFAFLPITSFSLALTTFIGQNLGAEQYDRAKQGARFGIIAGVSLTEIIGILIWIFAPKLVAIFNSTPDVIKEGVIQANILCPFYFLLALSHCLSGILRGAGKTNIPMIVMLVSWCLIRIAYITIMVKIIPDIRVVFWAYPLTWFISSVIFLIYYKKTNWLAE